MDNRVFTETRTQYGCYGINKDALRQLEKNWVALEGEMYEDNRVNWLFEVKIVMSPSGCLASSGFANNGCVQNICERLHTKANGKEDKEIHCILYGMEKQEISIIVGLYGLKEYTKNEIRQLCVERLKLGDEVSIIIQFIYSKNAFKIYTSYVSAMKNRKQSNII